MDHVSQRLQQLEQEFQRSRCINRMLVFGVVLVVGVAATRTQTPDTTKPSGSRQSQSADNQPDPAEEPRAAHFRAVEASQFTLLDAAGRSRAKMTIIDDGPALCMFDEGGQKRLELRQNAAGSGIRLFDSNELPLAMLQLADTADRAQLEIRSPQGSSVMKASGFSVRDAAEHSRLHLSLVNGNFASLGISQGGQLGPPAIEMVATEGSRSLKLHNDQGNLLFSLFAGDDGSTILNMRHPEHERSVQIASGVTGQGGPEIAFFAAANEDGTGGLLPFLRLGFDHARQPLLRIIDRDGQARFDAPSK